MAEGLSPDLIQGRYAVDPTTAQPHAGGGLPAVLARDRFLSDAPRTAIVLPRNVSPRLQLVDGLGDEAIENLMLPLARGVASSPDRKGETAYLICTPPPGPPLSENLERWSERSLLDLVVGPLAVVLDTLQRLGCTHRGIRLNNVFQASAGQPVTLGAAWAAPAAWNQPVISEPAYSAMCHVAGRGEGTTADDIYALGVLLLTLSMGRVPLAGFDDASVVRLKIDLGSYAALTRDGAPSGVLGDLLRSMLADDADHRPSPKLLLDTAAARGRRVAARPPRRSVRGMRVNEIAAFDSRMLAYALALDDKRSLQLLRSGQVSQWLRRDLADAALAAQIEDLLRARAAEPRPTPISDALLVMQVVATINPRMPLAWRGILLWPDALPALVAEAISGQRDMTMAMEELLTTEVISLWSALPAREGRGMTYALPPEVFVYRQSLVSHHPGGLLRMFYVLNPTLPCRARQVAERWITTVPELVQVLEATAPDSDVTLIDLSLAVFIAARGDRKMEPKVTELTLAQHPDDVRRLELELLRDLQSRFTLGPLPRLAKWMAERVRPGLARWHNRPRREDLNKKLTELSRSGSLSRLLGLVQDPAALSVDFAGMRMARNELERIERELQAIDLHSTTRLAQAERAGQAIAGGIGLAMLILAVLGSMMP
jgi:hypothetical protein